MLQSSNGSFTSFASSSIDMKEAVEKHTTFSTSLILIALSRLPKHSSYTSLKKSIVTPALAFLLNEKHSSWTWNYWQSTTPEQTKTPDDLDATACALAAIQLHSPKKIDGEALSHIVKMLCMLETKEGGPYFTWCVDTTQYLEWKDIDLVVNANIGYFLSIHDIHLPQLESYVKKHIRKKNNSKYYHSSIVVLYFICRYISTCSEDKKSTTYISQKLIRIFNTHTALSIQEIALATSALLYINPTQEHLHFLTPYIKKIQSSLKKNSLPASPLYIQHTTGSTKVYSGSTALTLAFCIEALSLFQESKVAIEKDMQQSKLKNKAAQAEQSIVSSYKKHFSNHKNISQHISYLLEKTTSIDPGHQITLLPFYFYHSLRDTIKRKISNSTVLLQHLGTANLSGWIAYRIYDDFLDNEGDTSHLSLANASLTWTISIYKSLISKIAWPLYERILLDMDNANAWEYAHTYKGSEATLLNTLYTLDLPDYGNHTILAQKSLPHCLGPITLLLHAGFNSDSPYIKHLIAFFTHYLIARQLNDDAHDWQKDLQRGYINSATVPLLKKFKELHENTTSLTEHDLQKTFWYECIDDTAKQINQHIKRAKTYLQKLTPIVNKTYLESLLDPLSTSAQIAIKEKEKTVDFLHTY